MELLRQNAGIDIAKDSFVATFTTLLTGQLVKHGKPKKFENNLQGFKNFSKWIAQQKETGVEICYTMEATGVYYESLAYYLIDQKQTVHVLLPNKVKKFAESLNIKSKTDNIDSKILGQLGVERQLDEWVLCSRAYQKTRTLTRERQQIIKERTVVKNQLHAEQHSGVVLKTYVTRANNRIKYLNKQIARIEKELRSIVSKDKFLQEKVNKITTIPGLGFISVVSVISETQGFVNISNLKQLSSYAGLDVSIKESGKWKGKARISKKGNSHIRQALYMPALSTIQHSQTYKTFYNRVYEKQNKGLIGIVAVQRKLLGLIYTLWENDSEYIENYSKESKKKDKESLFG